MGCNIEKSKSDSNKIKYDLKIIFYGNTPREIIHDFEQNREILLINNDYYYYNKYNWYIYLTINNQRINTINRIKYIIENKPPSRINPSLIFRKNVIINFIQTSEAMNLIQHYQTEFFLNDNIEDDMPYLIFDESSLILNNQNIWDIRILINEEKEIINISVVNQNLQIYQKDFFYEDFLKCRIFRNYNSLRDIYDKLQEKINANEYYLNINKNTEKLEIYFPINQRPNNSNAINSLGESYSSLNSTKSNEIKIEKECVTPFGNSKKYFKLSSTQKTNQKIIADNYDCLLIVEQNIFLHVSIIDLINDEERLRLIFNVLLDVANYFNYLPLLIDENKTSYNSFNIMLVGKSQSGKSLLMNKIAGKNITRSAQGTLRTEDIFMRDILNGKINIYDTCGASNHYLARNIFFKLNEKIDLLNKNGEKIDLLLIVIKKNEMPDEDIFKELLIKLIQLNLNYLIVINYTDKVINTIKRLVRDAFLENGCQIDYSNIVDVNILRDITPLYRKIFEKFSNSRITTTNFLNNNLINVNNLENYSRNNNLLLYKDISFDNIFKRKNWEAEKKFFKYRLSIIGTNFVPIANLLVPFILTLKFISELNNIYLGFPIFGKGFLNNLRRLKNMNNNQRSNLLKALAKKTGLKFLVKLGAGFGIKNFIKLGMGILIIFPALGYVADVIIGNAIDVPTFNNDYNLAKEEYLEILKSRTNNTVKKIINDYNDAINYFGRRGDLDIDQNAYNIPIGEEINNVIDFELDELLDLIE